MKKNRSEERKRVRKQKDDNMISLVCIRVTERPEANVPVKHVYKTEEAEDQVRRKWNKECA